MLVRFRVAREARASRVRDCVLCLLVTHESLESPASRTLVQTRVFDHHVNSPPIALEDDSVHLLGFPQLVDNH